MAGGVSGVGGNNLGIDTGLIIDSIIQQRTRRITSVEDRISKAEEQKRSLLDVNSRLLTMQDLARRLMNGTSFNSSVIRSSRPESLLATGDTSQIEGTFSFYTKSLASVAQYVSNGFADTGTARVTSVPGNLTIEVGDSSVSRATDLDNLNGGLGIDRGKIRITDDAGRTAVVDLSYAVSVNDVLDAINNNGDAQVIARVNDMPGTGLSGHGIVIENLSGNGTVSVANVGLGQTATTLGIAGEGNFGVLVGERINTIGRNTPMSLLNDGRGVGDGSSSQKALTVTDASGTRTVNISAARTLGEVMDLFNAAGTARLSVGPDGRRLVVTDDTVPSPTLNVTEAAGTGIIRSLGLNHTGGSESTAVKDAAAGTITGGAVIGAINSVRMTSLGGADGGGFTNASPAAPHTFDVIDSMGAVTTVVYTGEESLSDLITRINNPLGPGANVRAKVDSSGMGIELTDLANGPGTFTVTDTAGTTAAQLGVAGSHESGTALGASANFMHFHGNRLLTDFGLDEGFISGRIEIIDRSGVVRAIDVSNVRTVGELVNRLNATPTVSVSLSPTGDGLRFTDSSGGTGSMVVRDVSGNIMRKLGLAGTYENAAVVDRRQQYVVEVTAFDTLNDVVSKIQGLNIPVVATTVNDGTAGAGYRLSITGKQPGARNAVSVRSDLAGLNFSQTSRATDAVMLYGNAEGTADPVVVRSNTNSFKRVLPGVTIDLLEVSNSPVTISVTKDLQAASNDIRDLFDSYNGLGARVKELAGYDSETRTSGPLLGNGTVQRLGFELVAALIDPVDGLPVGSNTLAAFGIIRKVDGTFEVDQAKLLSSLESRFEEIRDVFSNQASLDPDSAFSTWNNGSGLTTGSGVDLRISFADGSAPLEISMGGMDRLGQLLDLINNDGRAVAEISPDGRTFRIRDNTTPAGTNQFKIEAGNNSGVLASLGILRTTPLPGSTVIESKAIQLGANLGVARRLEQVLNTYTARNGLIEDQTKTIDDRITRFNEDIRKMEERIDAEREQLERRFAAMEAALAESQQASSTLTNMIQAQQQQKK